MLESLALCRLRSETAGSVSGFCHNFRLPDPDLAVKFPRPLTEDSAESAELSRANSFVSLAAGKR